MTTGTINVKALWDKEAKAWIATSEDVPGLCAEAPTLETLIDVVLGLIPDLLELNDVPTDRPATHPVHIVAEQTAMVRLNG